VNVVGKAYQKVVLKGRLKQFPQNRSVYHNNSPVDEYALVNFVA
jgi:hypothetical protein